MNTFFTSDMHFGHANIIRYCNRPFATADEMNNRLIENWNYRVGHDDVVYVLGDVFFCEVNQAKQIAHRLHGRKRLIYGNHDKLIRNQKPLQDLFEKILPDLYEETIEGIKVVMCHYPMLSWNKARGGAYQLHGHVHTQGIPCDGKSRRYDVGVDANGYTPVSWKEIRRVMDKVEPFDSRDR